jgi:hypothetical protein
VGHNSNRVIDDSTNDKNGILSHEGAHAAGQPGQGDVSSDFPDIVCILDGDRSGAVKLGCGEGPVTRP